MQTDDDQGWAPASYVDPIDHDELDEPEPDFVGKFDLNKQNTISKCFHVLFW